MIIKIRVKQKSIILVNGKVQKIIMLNEELNHECCVAEKCFSIINGGI